MSHSANPQNETTLFTILTLIKSFENNFFNILQRSLRISWHFSRKIWLDFRPPKMITLTGRFGRLVNPGGNVWARATNTVLTTTYIDSSVFADSKSKTEQTSKEKLKKWNVQKICERKCLPRPLSSLKNQLQLWTCLLFEQILRGWFRLTKATQNWSALAEISQNLFLFELDKVNQLEGKLTHGEKRRS